MPHTVFFSWQDDTPHSNGHDFIENALDTALAQIALTTELEQAIRDELVLDKDTKGVPGQPPIAETIFRKIDGAAVFVPDLTFVGKRKNGRPMPNPNVLIEYGWALKSLGHARIVAAMNTAYGEPKAENMSFDLAHLRFPICYCLAEDADESTRKIELERLAAALRNAILAVLEGDEFKLSQPQAPAPPPFPAAEPKEGLSRFRPRGIALGEKLALFSNIAKGEVRLSDGPSVWLRVMPSSDPGKKFPVPTLVKTKEGMPFALMPILEGAIGYNFLRAADGIGIYPVNERDENVTRAVVFAFSTGEIWAIDTYALNPAFHKNILPDLESELSGALKRYASFLSALSIQLPYKWIAGMEGVQGREIYLKPPPGKMFIEYGPHGNCLWDVIVEEGRYTPEMAAGEELMPLFKKVYEACGLERPDYYPIPK
jgi:hypothetical protein